MKNKILLISITGTPRINNKAVDLPLSYLRNKGYNVKPYYYHGSHDTKEVIATIKKHKNCTLAFNITVYNYEEIIDIINHTSSNNIAVIFGEYATQFYREIFAKCPLIDFAVLGDLEQPLEDLIDNGFNLSKAKYKDNIVSKDNYDNKYPYYNYDYFMPAFDYLEQLLPNRRKRVEYIIQSKNQVCTGKCTFCRSMKGKIFFRKLEDIIEEIKVVTQNYGVQKIFFTDDNILDGGEEAVSRLFKLCDIIIENNIKVAMKCYFKATSCYTKNLLRKMHEAGFSTIFVGLESGNQEDLLLYNKLTTIADNDRVMKDIKEAGIFPQIGFLTFNPYTTLKKLNNNYYFLLRHEIDDLFMWISSVRIFKYTPLYELSKKDSLLIDGEDYVSYKSRYRIQDTDGQKVYDFVMNNMYDRVFKLSFDFEFMYGFYLDVLQTHPTAIKYKDKLLRFKEDQIKRIAVFFKHLYVDYDLDYAEKRFEDFLKTFEEDQEKIGSIYNELLEIYIS